MEKLQNRWFRLCNQVLMGLFALLGFTACGDEVGLCMYGTPTAKYCVKGKVVDAETQKPLAGIRIVSGSLLSAKDYLLWHHADTVYSKGSGEFEIEYVEFPGNIYRVIWEDIREAPEYKKDSTDIALTGKYSGGDSWYKGQMDLNIQIKAKKK